MKITKTEDEKGFTLAELLIVIAIIAVLVAVSIPVFIHQLEKSREATDLANVRGAYAEVSSAAILEDKSVPFYRNDAWMVVVDLKQAQDGWTTKVPLTIGSVTSGADGGTNSDETWIGKPSGHGTCIVSCSKDGKVIFNWTGSGLGDNPDITGPTYKKQLVTETAKDYEEPINNVLQTLYNELVAGRLGQEEGQISYVLFNSGKVTSVCTYTAKSPNGGYNIKSELDLDALNQKIADSLAATGFTTSGTCRIFFDREGNCISNSNGEGGWLKIGGQGIGASLTFVKDKKATEVRFYDDETGWYKK